MSAPYAVTEGARVLTPHGPGVIAKLDAKGRTEVHLDWCLADGKNARAYLAVELVRPVVLEVDPENNVIYKIVEPKDAAEVIDVTATAFDKGEPLTKQCGSTQRDMKNFVSMYVPRMAKEGYTVAAIDSKTGEVLGAFLNEDFNNPDPAGIGAFLDNSDGVWMPVLTMIESLEEKLLEKHNIPANPIDRPAKTHFHLWMIGVAPNGRGRGVGKKLFTHSVGVAKACGFKLAFAECTGAISTHIFKKYLNPTLDAYVDYKTWDGVGKEDVNKVPDTGHPGMSMLSVAL